MTKRAHTDGHCVRKSTALLAVSLFSMFPVSVPCSFSRFHAADDISHTKPEELSAHVTKLESFFVFVFLGGKKLHEEIFYLQKVNEI